MHTLTNATPTTYPTLSASLAQAAHQLGQSITAYNARSAGEESPGEAREMVHAFHRLLNEMLPNAPVDLLESMVELCAIETARARLENQADNGTLPVARIVDLRTS